MTASDDVQPRFRLHHKVFLLCMITAVLMVFVALLLAAVGIGLLKLTGGAAPDTSMVILVVASAISDFWGAGIVIMVTRARTIDVTASWAVVRTMLLLGLVVLVSPTAVGAAVVMVALVVPAAWLGAHVGQKQAALRERERMVGAR